MKILTDSLLVSIIFLIPLPNLGTDIYTPSLPYLVNIFNTNAYLVKFTVTIYLITYGIGQLIFGILSDIIGRRNLLLTGLFTFIIITFCTIFVNNIYYLLTIRFIQGLSVSIISVLTKTILIDKYKNEQLKIAYNYKNIAQVLSIILAPLIGSYIQFFLNWKWSFIILALYGVLCFIATILFIPETCPYKNRFQLKTIQLNIYNICCNKNYILMTFNTGILYSIIGLFCIHAPFLIQDTMNYSSLIYAIITLCCGISYMFGSIISNKISAKLLFTISSILSILSSLILTILCFFKFISLFIVTPIFFLMLSCGLLLPRITAYTLAIFKLQAGTASAIFGTFVMLSMALIMSLSGFLDTENFTLIGITYLLLSSISTLLLIYKQLYKKL